MFCTKKNTIVFFFQFREFKIEENVKKRDIKFFKMPKGSKLNYFRMRIYD